MGLINKGVTGKESVNNSTTTPLASGATFTGVGEQNNYSQVGVMCKTDNTGTLYFDFSNDGSNWDSTFPSNGFKVADGVSEFHTAVKLGRYFRVRLVNDTGSQTYLRLTTYYGDNFTPSNLPLNQTVGLDSDAILTRSTVPQDEISIGRRAGVTPWVKFGYRTGLTSSGGEETIWATTGNFTPLTSATTLTIAYTGGGGSNDGAGSTGALTLVFYHLDSNGLPTIDTHTLGSGGSDVTSFSTLGINRVAVSSSGSAQTNNADINITATTGGSKQAVVPAGGSVTQQAIFHVGYNHTALIKELFINANRDAGGTPPIIQFKGYVFNRNVSTRYEVFRYRMDTNIEGVIPLTKIVPFTLNPSDVLYFTGDTNRDSTDVTSFRFSLNEYQRT